MIVKGHFFLIILTEVRFLMQDSLLWGILFSLVSAQVVHRIQHVSYCTGGLIESRSLSFWKKPPQISDAIQAVLYYINLFNKMLSWHYEKQYCEEPLMIVPFVVEVKPHVV